MDNELSALNVIFTGFYYWVTMVMMFLIHVITVAFFFFGWWIYFAFQNRPGITGELKSAPWSEPWNELMGPHMGGEPADAGLATEATASWARLNGVFWAAFLLFSWTAGSILSGAVIERIRSGAWKRRLVEEQTVGSTGPTENKAHLE